MRLGRNEDKTMSEKETYKLKEFIWLNVFGWIHWREEEYPNRFGYKLGDETCLLEDMVDPLSPEGAMKVLKKCVENGCQPEIKQAMHSTSEGFIEMFSVTESSTDLFAASKNLELAICLFSRKLFSK